MIITCPHCRNGITAKHNECKSCRGSGALDRPSRGQIGMMLLAALPLFILILIMLLRP